MHQNIIAAQLFHDRRQEIDAFAFDQIADKEQTNFTGEFALSVSVEWLKQLRIDAIINDFNIMRTKSSFDGFFGILTDGDHTIGSAERFADAPFQPTEMKRFLAERRISLIDVLENIMQHRHDKRSIGTSEPAPIIRVDMHHIAIAQAHMGVNAKIGQCGHDLEMAPKMDDIQRNATATDGLFELIKVNTVTGAGVRYGNKYLQMSSKLQSDPLDGIRNSL